MISFADSTNPAAIPSQTPNHPGFTHVAAYGDGDFAWTTGQVERFPAHVLIAVKPGDPRQALHARVLDVERFDATPADFPPFALERRQLGHDDPTCYTSILGAEGFGIEPVVAALAQANMPLSAVRFWVAWWWGRPFSPTAAEVLAEIKALTGLSLPVGCLWACQWQNGTSYDSSVLYGRDDFTR